MVNKGPSLVTRSARLGFSAIPAFTRKELQEREDELLDKGTFGAVRSIKGYPRLAVKEIYLSGQPDRLKEITKFELGALSRFSSATRCLRTMTSYTSSWTVMMGICNTLSLITEGLASPFPES